MNFFIALFTIMAFLCLGYYIFAASYAGVSSAFLTFWLIAAVGFVILTIICVLHKKKSILLIIPKWLRIAICIIIIVGIAIFTTMECMIISKMNSKAADDADYIVVLGAQVRGERITKSLAKRLDAAYDYLIENEDTKVICTGGQGTGEDISEAFAEKRYLMEKGIAEDRIIMEDKSTSTYENLKFTLEIIGDKDAKIAIVTNNFHVYRAVLLGKYVGFKNVDGIAGDSDNRLLLNYMVREGLALFKEFIVR